MSSEQHLDNPHVISASINELGTEVQVVFHRPGVESLNVEVLKLFEKTLRAQALAFSLALELRHDSRDSNVMEDHLHRLLESSLDQIWHLEGNISRGSLVARMLGIDLSDPEPENVTILSTPRSA